MDLPVKFPSETDVILEDVARFRALSPADRIRAIQGMPADGQFMIGKSPRAASIEEDALEQKRLERESIREFIKRHAD